MMANSRHTSGTPKHHICNQQENKRSIKLYKSLLRHKATISQSIYSLAGLSMGRCNQPSGSFVAYSLGKLHELQRSRSWTGRSRKQAAEHAVQASCCSAHFFQQGVLLFFYSFSCLHKVHFGVLTGWHNQQPCIMTGRRSKKLHLGLIVQREGQLKTNHQPSIRERS